MNKSVSLKLAKLLKEKGIFIDTGGNYYKDDGSLSWCQSGSIMANSCKNEIYDECFAPIIADVLMWMYEKHGVWIEVRKHTRNGLRCFSPYIDNRSLKEDVFFNDYDSPTEVYEAAITWYLSKK